MIKYIDLFCGIGGFRIAAEQVFSKHNVDSKCVFSSDIDSFACKSYQANFGEYPSGDLTKIKPVEIPDHDILFAGFPCQPFSIIGNGKGFNDTRGTLFFHIANILETKRPKAFVLENVKRLVSHKGGQTFKKIVDTLNQLNYTVEYRVLNALDYGLPQKRERVIIVGYNKPFIFNWPVKQTIGKQLEEILESKVANKYYASDYIVKKRKIAHKAKTIPSIWHENKAGNICSYPYSCALRSGASHNYLLVNGERRLTPREMLRLQGFPDSYKIVVPDTQTKKQAGNAVPVNLIRAVLESFLPVFAQQELTKPEPSLIKEKHTKYARAKNAAVTHR